MFMNEAILDSIDRLPERFRGTDGRPMARFRITAGDAHRDVVITNGSCRVEEPAGTPDVEIVTDAATWLEMSAGSLSGIEAFDKRRLVIRGSIERSLEFEPAFDRPDAGALKYSLRHVGAGGTEISVLETEDRGGDPLVLIHGLGATKASWLTVVPQLARRHRVLAIDLPGFGASSKPRAPYDAAWFAGRVVALLDELGIERAVVAGNSMGGRVAMEMGMLFPERVGAIACLCPAAAFSKRPALALVRLLRPEFGILAGRLPRARIRAALMDLFVNPSSIEGTWYDAAIDDFLRTWRSPRARLAFFCSLQRIYLDQPYGENGFWSRLANLKTPALYIYGKQDRLITYKFGLKVQKVVPSAKVAMWDDCGHVPQLEHPERTARTMLDFFATVSAGQKAG
jgi:pimeloyl-ACP methyl ester carboxylesterase